MLANVTDCDPDQVRIGDRVPLVCGEADGAGP
jgi:uncharacterized OB-fold protein